MWIYISADMEGVAGITTWEQVEKSSGKEYERCRRLMIGEVNAAVEGAFQSGAQVVTVNDAHHNMSNLLGENIHPKAQIISGSPKKMGMMEGIDGRYTAVCLLGYHARASSKGVLAHTYSELVHRLLVNNQEMGELGLNALLAGYYGVPVVFASGDQVLAAEAKKLLFNIETAVVKEARNYHVARSLSPREAKAKIKQGITRALSQQKCSPLKAPAPATISIEFNNPGSAAAAAILPRSHRIDAVTLTYVGSDYLEAYQAARSLIALAKGN